MRYTAIRDLSGRLARIGALAFAGTLAPIAARAQTVDPILVRGRSFDLVVYSPSARDSVADAARLSRLVSGCRVAMQVTAADSAEFVNRPAPPFPLDVWQVRDAIVLMVIPTTDRLVDCDDPRTQAALAPVRGIRVTLDTTYTPIRDADQLIVRRGDRVLRPLIVERHPVRRLGAGGFRNSGDGWLRLAFDRAELAPGPAGVIDDLTVEVFEPRQRPIETITIPWVAVRVAWESSLAARPVLGATVAPPVALPVPDDPRLRAMHDAYAAGEHERVVQLAAPRFFGGAPQSTTRRDARLHATMALLALGDTNSARVVATTLLHESPCVAMDAAAPTGVRELFAGVRRPVARCSAQTPLRTAVRAALLPGFARPGDGARLDQRMVVFAASVGATAAAVALHVQARDRYDEYLAFQAVVVGPNDLNTEMQQLHRRAERARHASVAVGTVSTLLWVGQGVFALRKEKRFAEELRAYSQLGSGRSVTVMPHAGPSGVGFSLSLTW